jgi:hypothetical protein
MNSKVKVTADKVTGAVIIVGKNPEFAHIRVEQSKMVIDDNGFARLRVISALVHGTVEDLKAFGWKKDQELEKGKIIFKESLEPFNVNQPERDYKIAGKTGIVCCQDGQPIYRKTFYTLNMNAEDKSEAHNNIDAIRAAYAEGVEVKDENIAGL